MKGYLVQDVNREGFRAIVQHEESKCRFNVAYPNVMEEIEIIRAEEPAIRAYLNSILESFGVVNPMVTEVEKLAKKFKTELATFPLTDNNLYGALAYDEVSSGGGWFLIMTSSKNEQQK